jgi:antitoxin component YwqK of YwqJK toxin-antitoxin module
MKKLLPILFILILSSCSKEVPFDQLVERDGVFYEVNSQTGFTGTSISYYGNGQIEEKRTYRNGKEDGLIEYYYENGQLGSKENWKDGKREGPSVKYYENGQMGSKENWKDGKREGPSEYYHENGQLSSKGNWKNGEIDGLSVVYFENGQLEVKVKFKNGKEDGLRESYYENGQLEKKSNHKDGKLDGPYLRYSRNGELEQETNYLNGLIEDGTVTSYINSSEKKVETYIGGVLKYENIFFKTGETRYMTERLNSQISKVESYYKNGQLREKYFTKKDSMGRRLTHGLKEEYDRFGNLERSICMYDGSNIYQGIYRCDFLSFDGCTPKTKMDKVDKFKKDLCDNNQIFLETDLFD